MTTSIYHGPWINWSHGNYFTGATLTISDRNGALLTSFIATYVALVGTQLWKILAFAIHQIRSTNTPEDGLFHQQQLIWRNTATPGGAAWTLFQQVWFWRSKAAWSFLRTFTWAVFATVYLIVFALAAVFSSEVSKAAGPQRLIVGSDCGYWGLNPSSSQNQSASAHRQTTQSLQASTYARACYDDNFNALQCSRYPVPSLPWHSNSNATCPFRSGTCIFGDTAAYQMTSDLMDSQHDLGINTRKRDRVQFQKVTTCAPVRPSHKATTDTWLPINYNPFNDTFWYMLYGSLGEDQNYTEVVSTQAFMGQVPYKLSVQYASSNVTNSTGWRPIRHLFRDNADMVIFFLSPNSMRFEKQVDDPWFNAASPVTNIQNETVYYLATEYAYTMGCAEQYRYCNPNNNLCGELMGASQLLDDIGVNGTAIKRLGMSTMQSFVAERLGYAAIYSSMWHLVNPRGASALQAMETVVEDLDQSWLPPNQWHNEVRTWFNGNLASFQRTIIDYAAVADSGMEGAMVAIADDCPECEYLCRNQIINETAETMSFSILGMAVVFVIGGAILVTSLVIDRVVGLLQTWFKFNLVGKRAWMLDDKLHVQRNMFDKNGMGRWHDADDVSVPVTIGREKFSRFPADEPFGPNSPDTPDHETHFGQKTDYTGVSNVTPGVYVRQ